MNYTRYSDEDLLESYSTGLDYSGKADSDLIAEIDRRGGFEALKQRVDVENIIPTEIRRVQLLVFSLHEKKNGCEAIRSQITSEILSVHELDSLVQHAFANAELQFKDRHINERTIIGSIIGTILSAGAGSLLWFYVTLQTGQIHYVLTPFLLLIAYPIIRLCTGQSRNNAIVFIATFLSAFIALPLGLWFYRIWMN